MIPYPIKFDPILKEKIWGGTKLNTVLGKKTASENVGESWEISDVNDNISLISNGAYRGRSLKEMISEYKSEFMGKEIYQSFGNNFPLLIKFLDAQSDLSVQVHPDNEMAKKHHNSFGKTEMWYIMDSDDTASIVIGLKKEDTDAEILNAINEDNVETIFNREKVKKGDSFFIPAGKIHAIGAGVLAAEIQQTSDITYRVYDWDRKDANGIKRELHTELAQKATKRFSNHGKSEYDLEQNNQANLVSCSYFTTNIVKVKNELLKDYSNLDSFVIFMCVEGDLDIEVNGTTEHLRTGETLLLPGITQQACFRSASAKVLEVYIDKEDKTRIT